jgi:hypothetical protein
MLVVGDDRRVVPGLWPSAETPIPSYAPILFWGAHGCSVLVSAFCRNELFPFDPQFFDPSIH